jgi:hypothetical protein
MTGRAAPGKARTRVPMATRPIYRVSARGENGNQDCRGEKPPAELPGPALWGADAPCAADISNGATGGLN